MLTVAFWSTVEVVIILKVTETLLLLFENSLNNFELKTKTKKGGVSHSIIDPKRQDMLKKQ